MSFAVLFTVGTLVFAFVVILACLAGAEIGYLLGRRGASSRVAKKEHLGAVQAAAAALLGLLLAFSVSMAVSRFETRKAAVVEEANAIGTAHLRASLLPEPQRRQAERLFARYVEVRLELARPDWYLNAEHDLRDEEVALQEQQWALGAEVAAQDRRAVTSGLYLDALNEMIDSQVRRDHGLRNHVPESLIYLIVAVAMLTLGLMGYVSGLAGGRSLMAVVVLSLMIAAVLFVIVDFDRPYRGILTVSQLSMVEVQETIERGLPRP